MSTASSTSSGSFLSLDFTKGKKESDAAEIFGYMRTKHNNIAGNACLDSKEPKGK